MVSYLATNLQDALEFRAKENVVPYCGGTDLMIDAEPNTAYLFLHKVPELKQIKQDGPFIRFGAACTFTEIAKNPLCPAMLREAILEIAAPAIRNLGTIGGNIGNGSAKADSALIFFALNADLRLVSRNNSRIVPINEFYLGRKKLDLKKDEIIAEVIIPSTGLDNYYYKKIGARNALAISRVSFAALIEIDNDIIKNCATAFGAVSNVIIRRKDLDEMLIGKTVKEAKNIQQDYINAYSEAIVPIRGRVSEEYRKDVCMNLLKDFLDSKLHN